MIADVHLINSIVACHEEYATGFTELPLKCRPQCRAVTHQHDPAIPRLPVNNFEGNAEQNVF
jgi:hypothetical protein